MKSYYAWILLMPDKLKKILGRLLMSKVLVTGGAGFIGSNLVDQLVRDGDQIVVVDDLSMGSRNNLPDIPQVTFYKHSVLERDFMERLLLKENFDYIYLLAAVASVAASVKRPFSTHQVNQEANLFIMEVIQRYRLVVKKVVFASSAAVYGNNPQLPKSEHSAVDPLTPYAIDKYSTERFLIAYSKFYHIPTAIVRFFNVYGPRQNSVSPYSGVLSLITQCLRKQTTFSLFGDGRQTRDFIYIRDVISALRIVMTTDEMIGDVYNVATGRQCSINDIILDYQHITGQTLKVHRLPARSGDIKTSYADISKIKRFGFKPMYSLSTGLREYWQTMNTNDY